MSAGTAVDLKCYRALLFILNTLFLVSGVLLIALGAYALTHYVDGVSESNLTIALIVLGSLVAIVSLFGCIGVSFKSRGMLKAYFAFVLVFMLVQIAVGITAYIYRDDIPIYASENWGKLTDTGKQDIERAFVCCGWADPTDRPSPTCTDVYGYTDGCEVAVNQSISDNLYIIGATAIAVGALELIVAIFACCLIQRIPTTEEVEKALLEEARRLNRDVADPQAQQYHYQSVPNKV